MSPQKSEMRKSEGTIDPRMKKAYWNVVQDCLVEILGFSAREAKSMGNDLRRKIDKPPAGISGDIFYHNEPFDVACDLAKKKIECFNCQQKYDSILERHYSKLIPKD